MHKICVYLSYAALHEIKISLMLTTPKEAGGRERKERNREQVREITNPGSSTEPANRGCPLYRVPTWGSNAPLFIGPVPGLVEPSLTPVSGVAEIPVSHQASSPASSSHFWNLLSPQLQKWLRHPSVKSREVTLGPSP